MFRPSVDVHVSAAHSQLLDNVRVMELRRHEQRRAAARLLLGD
jgi:hypothetical protein